MDKLLQFLLSGNMLIYASFLKDSAVGYRILWHLLVLSVLWMCHPTVFSDDSFWWGISCFEHHLHGMSYFSLTAFKILSLDFDCLMRLGVDPLESIILEICWGSYMFFYQICQVFFFLPLFKYSLCTFLFSLYHSDCVCWLCLRCWDSTKLYPAPFFLIVTPLFSFSSSDQIISTDLFFSFQQESKFFLVSGNGLTYSKVNRLSSLSADNCVEPL